MTFIGLQHDHKIVHQSHTHVAYNRTLINNFSILNLLQSEVFQFCSKDFVPHLATRSVSVIFIDLDYFPGV